MKNIKQGKYVQKIKQTATILNRYYLAGMVSLVFILFLSQKENFIPTIVGITLTLISFFLILKVKTTSYNHQLLLETLMLRKQQPSYEEDGVFARFDKNFKIIYKSKEFVNIMDIDEKNIMDLLKKYSNDHNVIKTIEKAVKENHAFSGMLELTHNGKTIYLDTFIHKLSNKTLTISEYIIRCNDITSYIISQEELKNQLFIDKYTNLPTRLKLLDALDIAKHNTKCTHAHTLFYIQIDSYEEINEFFGIDTGHKLLKAIALWLQNHLPTKNTIVYKFDHNNFAMHTTSRINVPDLESYLKTLNHKISNENFFIHETNHDISFSIGIARGKDNLLKNAYLALKEAHRTNKAYKIFNKKNTQEAKYLQNIETNKSIKKALQEDRIVPFFQPILNMHTNEIEKYESLMRIQNEDNTYKSPAEFLEVSKQSKLYPELTKAMINGSLKRLEFFQKPITLNISIDDILNQKVASFIIRKLQRHPFSHLVTFEILETNEILNYTKVANFIKKIKNHGCQVAIDDFGSGYSNFEQVLKLDIDYIKIDGSLIKNIHTNKENEIVTKTIIAFAKELGVKTIAEFVYNEAIFQKVKLLGIDYAQGYHIGRPAPIKLNNKL